MIKKGTLLYLDKSKKWIGWVTEADKLTYRVHWQDDSEMYTSPYAQEDHVLYNGRTPQYKVCSTIFCEEE